MKYTLEELVKSYYMEKIHADVIEEHIKIVKKLPKELIEDIEDLEKEKELCAKKVKIVEDYFKEDTGAAPIRRYLTYAQYTICQYYYIKNITDKFTIADNLYISKDTVNSHIANSMQRLREVEIEINI